MQKIRIGNDVRLNITLKGQRVYDSSNVKELRCYLINTEYQNESKCSCKNQYLLHQCGCPSYHVLPCDRHACFNHSCRTPLFPPLPMWRPIEQQKPKKCCVDFVDPNAPDEYKYLAPSKMTSKQNGAIVYFPACDQKMLGTYKLVVVVVTFEPGWGRTDLRTYTIDYGSVLELVDSDQAVSGDITIDVDTDTMQYSNVVDIKAVNKTLYMKSEDTLCLGEMDYKSHYYEIKVQLENGSIVTYNPYNWPYEKLVFSSSKTDVNIDAESGIIRTSGVAAEEATITVKSKSNSISETFNVAIDAGQYSYIGFNQVRPFDENSESDSNIGFNRTDDSYEAASQETVQATGANNVDLSSLTKVKDPTIPTNVKNTVDGSYLWIITPEPISIAAEANSTITGGFATYIPLTKAQFSTNNNLYYYACPNPIKADKNSSGSNIYVKFK